MQCTNPTCIHYYETDKNNNIKRPVCLLFDIDINYKNIDRIENCLNHKTYKKLKENWKNIPCN